jgi:hypothetical protein
MEDVVQKSGSLTSSMGLSMRKPHAFQLPFPPTVMTPESSREGASRVEQG